MSNILNNKIRYQHQNHLEFQIKEAYKTSAIHAICNKFINSAIQYFNVYFTFLPLMRIFKDKLI